MEGVGAPISPLEAREAMAERVTGTPGGLAAGGQRPAGTPLVNPNLVEDVYVVRLALQGLAGGVGAPAGRIPGIARMRKSLDRLDVP
jgi:hypothetical protein